MPAEIDYIVQRSHENQLHLTQQYQLQLSSTPFPLPLAIMQVTQVLNQAHFYYQLVTNIIKSYTFTRLSPSAPLP